MWVYFYYSGHPNARLFINHAGMLGTQETIYHGVPILALPFGNDQKANAAKAERDGWGLKLDWDKVNDQSLKESILYLINNPEYEFYFIIIINKLIVLQSYSVKESTKKFSKLMRDEILPGKDVATYWIEYVIRHGGTKHLQLASKKMPFYQKYLLDVTLFLEILLVAILLVDFYIIGFVIRKCLVKINRTRPLKAKQK